MLTTCRWFGSSNSFGIAKSLFRALGCAALVSVVMVQSADSWAQTYPSKPIRVVVPFAVGGPTDIMGRLLAQKLGARLGWQFVVDSRGGAGGNIGAEIVAKAPPDGYTLLYPSSSIAVTPALHQGKVNFDPVNDFEPVVFVVRVPLAFVVNPALPVKTLREFIDYAKVRPGQLNYGSSGNGAIDHLGGFFINKQFGIDAQHVPYKGNDLAMTDLAAGRIQYLLTGLLTHASLRDGRVLALGVTSVKRNPVLPNVQTFHETVMPNFDISSWQGLLAPAKTPASIIARLNEEVNRTISSADYRDILGSMGAEVVGGTAEEWGRYYRGEYARWTQIVKESGVTP